MFLTTCGALLIFVAYRRMRFDMPGLTSDQYAQAARHHRRLTWALGLVAASLVLQCAAFFFL